MINEGLKRSYKMLSSSSINTRKVFVLYEIRKNVD